MRLTFVHPAIGHRAGESYIRTWQMESLPVAVLAGLTPRDVDTNFFDDRMEAIDYDAPTDAVAIPIETYTAARAYQIASEYRRRNVPVIMGGFHATLVPDEVARYAEAVVTGEAEGVWAEVIDDLRHGTLERRYHGAQRPLSEIRVDRRLFKGKRYLPIGLVETGRGCHFPCEFCAIQTFFSRTYRARPVDDVVGEIKSLGKRVYFFVDDNFAGDLKSGKPLLGALAKLNVRWITQMSIDAAHDEGFLEELRRAGCRGVLIGFESLDEKNLAAMNKRFNSMRSGFRGALANLRKHRIFVYGTFIFGYEHDTASSFDEAVDFATSEGMYIAAFNHLTPFPGTPLYARLQSEGRLRFEAWWRDPEYRYNALPFTPKALTPEEVTAGCVAARRRFYSWRSIARRSTRHARDAYVFRNFFLVNAMHRAEISKRDGYPLGDESWQGPLLEVGAPSSRRLAARRLASRGGGTPPGTPALRTTFRIATPSDDATVRALLRETAMPSWADMAIDRAPSSYDWAVLAEEAGDVVGVYIASILDAHVDGHPQRLGYLGGLRVKAQHRQRIRHLREGYASVPRLAREHVPWWFTTIGAENVVARRLLEAGVRGLPEYHFRGEYVTYAIPTSRARRRGIWRRGIDVALHNRLAAQFQCSPVVSEETPGNFFVCDGGVAALWDQRALKRIVAARYRTPSLIPIYNAYAKLFRRVPLPREGGALDHTFIAFFAMETPTVEAIEDLLSHCTTPVATIGMHAENPLRDIVQRFKPMSARSRVYAVSFDGSVPPNGRPAQPEAALL